MIRNFSTNPKWISGSQTTGTSSACSLQPLDPYSWLPFAHVKGQTSSFIIKATLNVFSFLKAIPGSHLKLRPSDGYKHRSQQLLALYSGEDCERRAQTGVWTPPNRCLLQIYSRAAQDAKGSREKSVTITGLNQASSWKQFRKGIFLL